jgi:hypothetical protein
MRLRESHGPFSNPEGADFEVTKEHLQPWEVPEHRALQHSRAFTCGITTPRSRPRGSNAWQHVFPGMSGDRNTLRIGVIVLSAAR